MSARHRVNTMLCQHDVLSKWHPSQTSTVYQHGVWSRRHRVKTTSCQHGVVPRRCRVIATPSWGSLASIRHRVIKKKRQNNAVPKTNKCEIGTVPTRRRANTMSCQKRRRDKTVPSQDDVMSRHRHVKKKRCRANTPLCTDDAGSKRCRITNDVVST